MFALTWNDVDFETHCIKVNKSYKISKDIKTGERVGHVQPPKTLSSNRLVPMPAVLEPILLEHKNNFNSEKEEKGIHWNTSNLVFCNSKGGYLDSQNLTKRKNKFIKENNLNNFTFHSLRHTYTTILVSSGNNPKVVADLLGHSNTTQTLNIYTNTSYNDKTIAVESFNHLSIV